MIESDEILIDTFYGMLDATRLHLSSIQPSEWYEQKMIMPRGSAFPGPFSYDSTPFWREPVNCVAKDHPCQKISIMKGAQSGGSAAVLNAIVGYIIAQNPGNMMFLTGHSELSEAAFLRLDQMILNTGIQHLIRPHVIKARNTRSGDTNQVKEFPGGTLWGGSVTNHNLLRQYDVKIMIVDDFDAAPMSSKAAGSTISLVHQRTAAFGNTKKIIHVSSPQIEGISNIETVFNLGDKRFWNVACPQCHSFIVLQWNIQVTDKESAGITWKLDNHGHLDRKTVGYVCQECGDFFTDSHKYEMNMHGYWEPTVKPVEEYHQSYQLSSLYAPPFMDNWATLVQKYLETERGNGKRDEKKYQSFVNVILGWPYKQTGKTNEANILQKHTRNYQIGVIPEFLAQKDKTGGIILLTLACDLNGKLEDARLDWELVAWAKNGSSYSVKHGSIGTFIANERVEEKNRVDRIHWTYESQGAYSVWPELEKIITTKYETDTGEFMSVAITGVDSGYCTNQVYSFIDEMRKKRLAVIGVRGKGEDEYRKVGLDSPSFNKSKERPASLYMLDVNYIKDVVSIDMEQNWNFVSGEAQPTGFMNYPQPSGGLYSFTGFFEHYQSEHSITEDKDGKAIAARWVKVATGAQNHFWDVYVYNRALKDIWADMVLKANKPPLKGGWAEFVKLGEIMKIF